MPASPKSRTINLRVELVPKLRSRWEKAKEKVPSTNPEFGGYINDLLSDVLIKEDFLAKMSPHLEFEGYTGNTLFIFDNKRNQRAEIYRHDNNIKCALDDSFDCEHIHFALGLPEVAKLNIRLPKRY